jgi:hypothetical protein
MLALSVAKPCHENWENMIPGEKGAYCESCCKSVIDFTSKSDEQILDYFQKKEGESVCGRFRNDQLNRPLIEIAPSIFMMKIPFWKKFLAALFIYFSAFISGCNMDGDKDYTSAEVPPVSYYADKTSPDIIANPEDAATATDPEELPTKENGEPGDFHIKYFKNYVITDWKSDVKNPPTNFVTMGPTITYPSFPLSPPFPDLKIK